MSELLRLLFKFHSEYSGDPRFISGNAFRHTLSSQVSTSIGIFTDIDRLISPLTYQEFFLIRTKKCFAYPNFEKFFDWNNHREWFRHFTTPPFVTYDVLEPPSDLVEIIRSLEPLQFGGQRHAGCGAVTLYDAISIDVEKITFPTHATHLTLIAPMVHFPPFVYRFNCRREQLKLWNHGRLNQVEAIAPGQFFRIKKGEDIPELAKKGILRKVLRNKALFSQFGYGEFMVHNWSKGGA